MLGGPPGTDRCRSSRRGPRLSAGLQKSSLQVFHDAVEAQWVILHRDALTYAAGALLRCGARAVGTAGAGTGPNAVVGNRAVLAHEGLPTSALPIHTEALATAIVGTRLQIAVWTGSAWRAHSATAVCAREADVAGAVAIHTKAIPGAVVGAASKSGEESLALAARPNPAVIAEALPWAAKRWQRASSVRAAQGTVRFAAGWSSPARLAPALTPDAFPVAAAVGRADFVLAGVELRAALQ
mmetsp:Transcript_20745/g.45598  ORF Transcript_20745/g.45598 Transcript_20745/m.45598 type:complete len:240 (-) Transcript_20745:2331-3050(-)